MATLIPNNFSQYSLTKDEEESGKILTTQQQQVVQNKIAYFADLKIKLIFDPKDPNDFGIQVAYLTGKIEVLQEMLFDSEETQTEVVQRALQQSQQSKE